MHGDLSPGLGECSRDVVTGVPETKAEAVMPFVT